MLTALEESIYLEALLTLREFIFKGRTSIAKYIAHLAFY